MFYFGLKACFLTMTLQFSQIAKLFFRKKKEEI